MNGTGSLQLNGGVAVFGGTLKVGQMGTSLPAQLCISNAIESAIVKQSLTIESNGELTFDVNLSLPQKADPIISANALNFNTSGQYAITLSNLDSVQTNRQIGIIESATVVDADIKNITWQIDGITAGYDVQAEWEDNTLYLNITVIPESSATAALFGLLALLVTARRKK